MRSPVNSAALAFVAGVGAGIETLVPAVRFPPILAVLLIAAGSILAWRRRDHAWVLPAACAIAGLCHGAAARDAALHTVLRDRLDSVIGGASIDHVGVLRPHPPFQLRAVLADDAADGGEFVSLRADAQALLVDGHWLPVTGGLVISVNGMAGRARLRDWSRGRTIEAPVSFRRPTRYLDEGVPDLERDAALGGITLFGSVKSPLLVAVVSPGSWIDETAASIRRNVRGAMDRWVAPHGAVPAAVVTAVLIGDRGGLPAEVRSRLQAAGTYHVIAISGGNIAILAALLVGISVVIGVPGPYIAIATILALLAYAQVALAGPSVWRATLMASLYFGARIFDQRTPTWHALALAAAAIALVQPLDVRDAGFLLTFGATGALLGVAPWLARRQLPGVLIWLVASIAASLAAELVLLPVSASVFSRSPERACSST